MRLPSRFSVREFAAMQKRQGWFLPYIPALCAALLLAGCSTSYNGERWFWKAQHLQASIGKDLSHATPEQLTKLIDAFDLVTKKAPGTVWAARAEGMVGSLYIVQKQYEKARNAFTTVIREYNQYQDVVLAARLSIAKTYESDHQWDEAVKVYQEISDYHPWSIIGLQAPLYVASRYEEQHKPELARATYDKALRLYTTRIPNAPSAEMAAQAKGYLAQALEHLGRWDQAAKTLEEVLQVPHGSNRPLVLLALGSIYQTKMQRPEKAVEMYRQLVREFPKHPYVKLATIQLQHLHATVIPQPASPTPTTP